MISHIKEIVENKKISVLELSKISGLSRTTINSLVKSDEMPDKTRVETIKKISTALQIPISQLIEEQPYRFTLNKFVALGLALDPNAEFPNFQKVFLIDCNVKTESGLLRTFFLARLVNAALDPDEALKQKKAFISTFGQPKDFHGDSEQYALQLAHFLASQNILFSSPFIRVESLTNKDFKILKNSINKLAKFPSHLTNYLNLDKNTKPYFCGFASISKKVFQKLVQIDNIRLGKKPIISWLGNKAGGSLPLEAFQIISSNDVNRLQVIDPYSMFNEGPFTIIPE